MTTDVTAPPATFRPVPDMNVSGQTVTFVLYRALRSPAGWMESLPQIKEMLKMKDKNDDSLFVYAARSDNAVMFDAVTTFVEHHLSPQEVKWIPGKAAFVLHDIIREASLVI